MKGINHNVEDNILTIETEDGVIIIDEADVFIREIQDKTLEELDGTTLCNVDITLESPYIAGFNGIEVDFDDFITALEGLL